LATKKYSVCKQIRLKPNEAKALEAKSQAQNMSQSAYIRFMISQKPKDYPEIRRLLKELIDEINHIGVNINQIAKNNNMHFYSKEDKESLLAYQQKLNKILTEVVDKIGN